MNQKAYYKFRYAQLRFKQLLSRRRRPEVSPKDHFGRSLQAVMRSYRPRRILEIGAWDGTGSTTCLLSKLDYEPECLHCVEYCQERASRIETQIQPLFPFVQVYQGSSISYDEWSLRDFDKDIWSALPEAFQKRLDREFFYHLWMQEKRVIEGAKGSFFSAFPLKEYDFVILDGGEFTAFDEWRLLKKRYKLIAFDDVFHAFKGYLPHREMLKDDAFDLIAASSFVRRGFSIFSRKADKVSNLNPV